MFTVYTHSQNKATFYSLYTKPIKGHCLWFIHTARTNLLFTVYTHSESKAVVYSLYTQNQSKTTVYSLYTQLIKDHCLQFIHMPIKSYCLQCIHTANQKLLFTVYPDSQSNATVNNHFTLTYDLTAVHIQT